MGSAAKPMEFFQPQSMSGELMAIFDKFSMRADEDTGIPRYITGDNAGMALVSAHPAIRCGHTWIPACAGMTRYSAASGSLWHINPRVST
jgi:hypothetical protein